MTELPDGNGVLLESGNVFGDEAFRAEAVARFPELESRLGECDGIHIAMGILRTFAGSAIERGDFQVLEDVYALLHFAVSRPDAHSEIENAVAISFLDPAELRGSANGRRALELMPPLVRDPILDAEKRQAEAADRQR